MCVASWRRAASVTSVNANWRRGDDSGSGGKDESRWQLASHPGRTHPFFVNFGVACPNEQGKERDFGCDAAECSSC